jgi:hypothetical protein
MGVGVVGAIPHNDTREDGVQSVQIACDLPSAAIAR